MGARTAAARAFALHDSHCWHVPLEFSLAAPFPSRTGDLCGGSLASKAAVTDAGYSGAWACRFGKRRRVHLLYNWFASFSAHLDFGWIGCALGLFGTPATPLRFSIVAARGDHILRLNRHISLPPDELRSADLQFFSRIA